MVLPQGAGFHLPFHNLEVTSIGLIVAHVCHPCSSLNSLIPQPLRKDRQIGAVQLLTGKKAVSGCDTSQASSLLVFTS